MLPHAIFLYRETKKINKTVILLLSKKKKTKKLLKHRKLTLWTFLVLWDKNISTKNHGTPNIHKIFDIRAVLKHIRVPLPNFGTARQNSFNIKSWYTTVLLIFFSIPGICETLNGSPAKRFGTVRQKKRRENCDTSPPPLNLFYPKKFSRIENFLIHRRVPIRKNLVIWDKICSTEKRDIRLLCLKVSTPEINEKKGFTR